MNEQIITYAHEAGILLPIVVIILIIIYATRVISIMDQWKMRKINSLISILDTSSLDEDVKAIVKSEVNNAAFTTTTGIDAGSYLREQLTLLHNKDKYKFSWKRLRMAFQFIEIENEKIVVKTIWIDNIMFVLGCVGTFLSGVLIGTAFIIFYYTDHTFTNIIVSIVIALIAGATFYSNIYNLAQRYHAHELSKSLKELED